MARTPKAQALGAALRQAREERKLLLRELAVAIQKDIGVLSRWETGDRTPKPEQVAQILATLQVGGERYEDIMTLAYGTNESQWVAFSLPEQRQQLAALVDWEQSATHIVAVAPLLIPGLLQTADYVRGIMTAAGVPAGEIALRVTSRLGRREAITKKKKPAELLVLLGQSALNQDVGGRQAMLGQLEHLLEMATRPNIDLRIVPDHRGWHPGLEGAFTVIRASRAAVGRRQAASSSIVFVGNRRSVLMLHEDRDVDAYKRAVDRINAVSLAPDSSVNLIAEVRNRMEKSSDSRSHLAKVES
jgi:transcriptional regulator with XRE-family HTH domain